ncbi:WD40-repeat-containing domain protein [Paraphysoderma sedebokerense]|nr:WD40-repeat-containing domain protein [Paraphysoderma sedebokerense]
MYSKRHTAPKKIKLKVKSTVANQQRASGHSFAFPSPSSISNGRSSNSKSVISSSSSQLRPLKHFDTVPTTLQHSTSLSQYLDRRAHTGLHGSKRQDATYFTIDRLSKYEIVKSIGGFDRRVTSMEWNEEKECWNSYAVLASKGGDLILLNSNEPSSEYSFRKGRGPGGQVNQIKFYPGCLESVVTASVDGTVRSQHLQSNLPDQIYFDTGDLSKWFTALDISSPSRSCNFSSPLLFTGMNTGVGALLDLRSSVKIFECKLHKTKIQDGEFHIFDETMLITAGNDRMVKVWDLRMLKERSAGVNIMGGTKKKTGVEVEPVITWNTDGVLSNATVSRSSPHLVLTTAQNSELRVYDLSRPDIEPTIFNHPHRHFQHITAQKGTWHPFHDLVLIGRYPDPSQPGDSRTVDVIHYDKRNREMKLVSRMDDSSVNGIHCLVKINSDGSRILSSVGMNSVLWEFPRDKKGKAPAVVGRRVTGNDNDNEEEDDDKGDGKGNRKKRKRFNDEDEATKKKLGVRAANKKANGKRPK